MKKSGIFFSVDALISFTIILMVVLLAFPLIKINKSESPIAGDILLTLSSLKVGELSNVYVQSLVLNGTLYANKTVLEQIGILSITDESLAKTIAAIVLEEVRTNENIGVWYENKLIFSYNRTNYENASNVFTERYIVSGLGGLNGTGLLSGYSARAYLSSTYRTVYSYFGGYVGEGNLTLTSEYNGTIGGADLELASNKDFQLYINGVYAGNYTKSQSTSIPSKYDLSEHLNKFNSGKNLIEFIAKDLYVAGGFLRIEYSSEPVISEKKQYFQGVNGLINIYDGLFVPEGLSSMDISLDLESNFTTFLNIGNVTVFNGTTDSRETITIPNSQLSTLLNYSQIINKTLPIRLGLRNVSLIYNNQKIDVLSVVDLSGSMDDNCPGGSANPGETPCKINDAKNATNELIDTILNISGNKVGLVGFEDYAKKSDFHNLSNNSQSLKTLANNVWDAGSSTCICCGILKAISCFDKEILYDDFNNQTNGSNPFGWSVSDSGAIVDITTDSLEGNKSVVIAKTGSSNPILSNRFSPQQDKLNIEFLVRQDTGTNGRFRLNVESLRFFGTYQNYIVLKMYNGQIRNNNDIITPYSLGTTYKLRIEIVPGAVTYNLYKDDSLVGSNLRVNEMSENIGKISFTTETSQINYKIDALNISLSEKVCDLENNKSREMIVMSDGEANQDCGLDPSQDWDGDNSVIGDPQDQAIEAACIANAKYNITVHSIALDVNNGSLAEQTMQGIAACGKGGFYTSNVTQLTQIYRQITRNILSTYSFQTFNSSVPSESKLFPNSYILLNYPQIINPFGVIITLEKAFLNSTSVSFSIPSGSIPLSATAISYSGDQWTNKVILNNETIYDLNDYGINYIDLGDPYAIKINAKKLLQNNSLSLTTASSSLNETVSTDNKVIYTISKNFSSFSPILAIAQGCIWNLRFDDNTTLITNVPSTYTGQDQCYFPSNGGFTHNSNDAFQVAVYNLLRQLDLNGNEMIDPILSEQSLQIDVSQVNGIPYTWHTEVQVRTWD